MENGQEAAADIDKFVDDMISHAKELMVELRDQGNRNDIKDRITCLKYLEEIAKTYFLLKKASTHDPAAAGSTVRKYAAAFAPKDATGVGKGRRGRPAAKFAPTHQPDTLDLDSDDDTAA